MDREQLLKEIFALEPDLLAKESEVRALVFSMLEHKPVIVSDAAMKAMVKARLLAQFDTKKYQSVKSPWTDWVWYAAPLSLVAVIVLMMIPTYDGQLAPYGSVPHTTPTYNSPVIRSGSEETISAPGSATVADEVSAKMEVMESGPEAATSEMRMYGTAPTTIVQIEAQKTGRRVEIEGVFSATPVFISVHITGQPESLGVSQLIVPGDNAPFGISLNAPIKAGGSYEVVVSEDNGDGVFVPASDLVLTVLPLNVLP